MLRGVGYNILQEVGGKVTVIEARKTCIHVFIYQQFTDYHPRGR